MYFNTIILASLLASLASCSFFFPEQVLYKHRSGLRPRTFNTLEGRATCEATCSNGACCNTGGGCTTDNMCCTSTQFACTDGGCCNTGDTCTTTSAGEQVCSSPIGCLQPAISCGVACCDAGMTCVQVSGQYRCEGNGTDSSTLDSGGAPVLGDGPANGTSSLSSASSVAVANATLFANGTTSTSLHITATTASSTGGVPGVPGVQITSSASSKSSASMTFNAIPDLQFLVHIAAGICLGAVVLLFQ